MARRYKMKVPVMILCGIAAIFLFGFIVMSLWNAILPDVITNVKPISLWQSMGLLLLAKILFGGFGGWRHKRRQWRQGMEMKWQHMTPEEKEKFKEEWKNRCNWRGRMGKQQAQTPDAGSEPVQ